MTPVKYGLDATAVLQPLYVGEQILLWLIDFGMEWSSTPYRGKILSPQP